MASSKKSDWEIAKVEYENALTQYRHYTTLRGQDLIFTTTVQAAVLTIIGTKLPALDFAGLLLSIAAFFSLLLGINSQKRASAYMEGFIQRAIQIEKEHGMKLITLSKQEVAKKKLRIPSSFVFILYHAIFIIAWVVIWIWNLLKILNIVI